MRRPLSRPPVAALLTALTLVLAACGSNAPGANGSDGRVIADAGEAGGAGEDNNALGTAEATPDFDYTTVDYDAEPVANALFGDRSNDLFPPAVVPIDEIRGGGPPPDGIPAIDTPSFVSVAEASFMESEEEAIIAVTVDGVTKGYPIRVMTWHEIVNDNFLGLSGNETPVTVTYCPLCNSALAYNRQFGARVLDFGTSGELFQSAMVMYDRQTQSLWSHFLGQGIVGHYAGAQLELLPAQTLGWGAFKAAFPDGLVLDQNATGFERRYGANPYNGYDDESSQPLPGFVTRDIDDRLPPKARVLGLRDEDGSLAIPFSHLAEERVLAVTQNDWNLVVFHQDGLASSLETNSVASGTDVGQSGVFVPTAADGTALTFEPADGGFVDKETGSLWSITGLALDGPLTGEQLSAFNHVDTFWFAWSIYQPETALRVS